MRIFIDGREVAVDTAKFSSSKELLAYCRREFCSGPLMIYKIEVAGRETALNDFLAMPLKDLREVKFFTKSKELLLRDALKEIAANLPGLAKDVTGVIQNFRNGHDKVALEDYLKILPLINTIILGVRSVEIGWQEDFNLDYASVVECLKKINEAYQNKDYVLLGDSLEYLLLPWFKTLIETIASRAK